MTVRFVCQDCRQPFYRPNAKGRPQRCSDCREEYKRARARSVYAVRMKSQGRVVVPYKTGAAAPVNKMLRIAQEIAILRPSVEEVSGRIGMLLALPAPPEATYAELRRMKDILDLCVTELAQVS